jgi:hypothetical protein
MVNHAGDRLISAMQLAQQYQDAIVLYAGVETTLTLAAEGTFELGPDILRQLGFWLT